MGYKIHYLRALAWWAINLPVPRRRSFEFMGEAYCTFEHPYNLTWLNERTVELPIITRLLTQHPNAKVLEVGHVLGHYAPQLRHDVVDKYEDSSHPALYKEDAFGFRGRAPYDLIVSISTIEHVGWDEQPRDPEKVGRTIHHLRTLLAPGGLFVFTAPIGYNPGFDAYVDREKGFTFLRCLKRVSIRNEWQEVSWSEIRSARFNEPYPFVNGLVVGAFGPLDA